jgi:Domain of unknown function (DUF3342)
MKYFEHFLAENDDSHDLDISVHCDVEIFEWLMNYIHNPCLNPLLDSSILVSILISSDFLLMDSLVDICLKNIAGRLQEFVKLPIDLSCISDKLVNKLAVLTHPKVSNLISLSLINYLRIDDESSMIKQNNINFSAKNDSTEPRKIIEQHSLQH